MANGEMNIYSNANYLDYYKQGENFFKAAERCFGEKNGNTFTTIKGTDRGIEMIQLSAPTVVNAAFACELFFKSLLIKSAISIPKGRNGHNLLELYNLLPNDIQDDISTVCFVGGTKNDFETFLNSHAEDFVSIRYFIENKGFSNMSPMNMYALAFNLMKITKAIISSGGSK